MTNVDTPAPHPESEESPSRPMTGALRHTLPAVGAALSLTVIFVAVLSIPLDAASNLGLSPAEATGWILAIYGVAGLLSLALALRYRQPLLVTGNLFILIFIASLGSQLSWPELVGASMAAGALVLLLGPLGLIDRLAAWLPAPIIFGLLAGAVLGLFLDLFSAANGDPILVGATLLTYLLGRRFLEPRLPAILPALVAALAIAGFRGQLGPLPDGVSLPRPELTMPAFSVQAIVTATPVMVVLISLQANVPSLVFLRSQDYEPPERVVNAISGIGTLFGSLLGPMGVSLSLPATALCAGPDAGEHAHRHRSVYMAGASSVAIALLAGFAAGLTAIVPAALLDALVGLAVFGVLTRALHRMAGGPLLLGPIFAFTIALSDLTLFGLGPFFWALVIGLAVSLLLERKEWNQL